MRSHYRNLFDLSGKTLLLPARSVSSASGFVAASLNLAQTSLWSIWIWSAAQPSPRNWSGIMETRLLALHAMFPIPHRFAKW